MLLACLNCRCGRTKLEVKEAFGVSQLELKKSNKFIHKKLGPRFRAKRSGWRQIE